MVMSVGIEMDAESLCLRLPQEKKERLLAAILNGQILDAVQHHGAQVPSVSYSPLLAT